MLGHRVQLAVPRRRVPPDHLGRDGVGLLERLAREDLDRVGRVEPRRLVAGHASYTRPLKGFDSATIRSAQSVDLAVRLRLVEAVRLAEEVDRRQIREVRDDPGPALQVGLRLPHPGAQARRDFHHLTGDDGARRLQAPVPARPRRGRRGIARSMCGLTRSGNCAIPTPGCPRSAERHHDQTARARPAGPPGCVRRGGGSTPAPAPRSAPAPVSAPAGPRVPRAAHRGALLPRSRSARQVRWSPAEARRPLRRADGQVEDPGPRRGPRRRRGPRVVEGLQGAIPRRQAAGGRRHGVPPLLGHQELHRGSGPPAARRREACRWTRRPRRSRPRARRASSTRRATRLASRSVTSSPTGPGCRTTGPAYTGQATSPSLDDAVKERRRPGPRRAARRGVRVLEPLGYQLAGRAVEQAAGQPFRAYLTEHVLRPLGMTSRRRSNPTPPGSRSATASRTAP